MTNKQQIIVGQVFSSQTGEEARHITHYSLDDLYDQNGESWEES